MDSGCSGEVRHAFSDIFHAQVCGFLYVNPITAHPGYYRKGRTGHTKVSCALFTYPFFLFARHATRSLRPCGKRLHAVTGRKCLPHWAPGVAFGPVLPPVTVLHPQGRAASLCKLEASSLDRAA